MFFTLVHEIDRPFFKIYTIYLSYQSPKKHERSKHTKVLYKIQINTYEKYFQNLLVLVIVSKNCDKTVSVFPLRQSTTLL